MKITSQDGRVNSGWVVDLLAAAWLVLVLGLFAGRFLLEAGTSLGPRLAEWLR